VVGGQGVGDVLEDHRLAGAGRGDDQAALALADRRHHVEHARHEIVSGGLEADALIRVQGGQVVEEHLVTGHARGLEVDGLHLDEREVALALLGRAHLAADGIACSEVELADLGGRDVDVVGTREVVRLGALRKP